jgi:hypothetical protein
VTGSPAERGEKKRGLRGVMSDARLKKSGRLVRFYFFLYPLA